MGGIKMGNITEDERSLEEEEGGTVDDNRALLGIRI
jgi:hypothetical protein